MWVKPIRFDLAWRRRFGLFLLSRSFRYSIVDIARVLAMVRWYSMRVRDTRATQRPTVTRGCVAVRGWFHKEWRNVRFGRMDATRRDASHPSIRSSLSLSLVPFTRVSGSITRVEYLPTYVPPLFDFDRRAL